MITINLLRVSLNVLPIGSAVVEALIMALVIGFSLLKLIRNLSIGNEAKRLKGMKPRVKDFELAKLRIEGSLNRYLVVFPLLILINFFYLIHNLCEWIRGNMVVFQAAREISLPLCYESIRVMSSYVVINFLVMFIGFSAYLLFNTWKDKILKAVEQDDNHGKI